MPKPEEVADGIHQPRAGGAKVTVLTGADSTVLVDAGGRGSHGRITEGLRALGLSPGQVGLIALTHYHPDHTGGLGKLVETTSARVAAHRLEAGILDGTVPAPSPFRRQVVAGITRPLMGRLYGSPVTVDLPLEDDDRLPWTETFGQCTCRDILRVASASTWPPKGCSSWVTPSSTASGDSALRPRQSLRTPSRPTSPSRSC